MRPFCSSRRQAFTLVELLVVIAIVALLAALLFPVFGRVRAAARGAVCTSNMRQIGMALLNYMQDYDETQSRRQNDAALTSWRRDVQPYIKSGDVFTCPSNPNNKLLSQANPETAHDPPNVHVSYALNNNDANGVGGVCNRHLGDVMLARIASPAQTISMGETTAYYSDVFVNARIVTGEEGTYGAMHDTNATGWNGHIFAGHNGQSHFWFMDGHVKTMKPAATINTIDPGNKATVGSPVNMWTLDNSSFTDADQGLDISPTPFSFARQNLAYSEQADR